ncbi:MRG/MORF4L-binding protein isoform X1 [Cervus canadensis]|uniref:MRG/MORF4L-binding protein isoform X1 n=1 Tax=Cervus canadensis TaxID=1574408 RepID=UPI001C9E896C|nr:MRG/MORF4L-binding protein isoform X1 [Cervus canadensis]
MGEAEVGGGGAAGDKGPGEAATSPAEETVVWSPEVEVCLFHAMLGHKPVGVNRHFHMICIRDKFSQNIGRQVPSKVIWDHLSTMYDMQALVSWTPAARAAGREPPPHRLPPPPPGPGLRDLDIQDVPQHESEILPFPNPERNFVLPEEIIQEVREGKVIIEEEMKEEMKEDVDPHNGADDVFSSSGSLGKATEKSSKDKEKNNSDLGSKEGSDKRKRSRVTDKVLTANSNPSSPSAAKRRRT